MIAVLMLQGKLSLNKGLAEHFKGINWTELNAKYKANYSKAAGEIMENIKTKRSKIKINTKL